MKKTLALFVALAMVLSLAACQSSNESGGSAAPETQAEPAGQTEEAAEPAAQTEEETEQYS